MTNYIIQFRRLRQVGKRKKAPLDTRIKMEAIGETHLKQKFEDLMKFKKYKNVTIVSLEEEK